MFRSLDAHDGVPVIRGRHHHRIDIIAQEHLTKVAILPEALVFAFAEPFPVLVANLFCCGLKPIPVHLGAGNVLNLSISDEAVEVRSPNPVESNLSQRDSV